MDLFDYSFYNRSIPWAIKRLSKTICSSSIIHCIIGHELQLITQLLRLITGGIAAPLIGDLEGGGAEE